MVSVYLYNRSLVIIIDGIFFFNCNSVLGDRFIIWDDMIWKLLSLFGFVCVFFVKFIDLESGNFGNVWCCYWCVVEDSLWVGRECVVDVVFRCSDVWFYIFFERIVLGGVWIGKFVGRVVCIEFLVGMFREVGSYVVFRFECWDNSFICGFFNYFKWWFRKLWWSLSERIVGVVK